MLPIHNRYKELVQINDIATELQSAKAMKRYNVYRLFKSMHLRENICNAVNALHTLNYTLSIFRSTKITSISSIEDFNLTSRGDAVIIPQ